MANCPNCGANINTETGVGYSPEYTPMSPWHYFALQLLFSVPIVGFVFLIIFSINRSNINRRNFARSYFCVLIIVMIIVGIVIATGGIAGIGSYLSNL